MNFVIIQSYHNLDFSDWDSDQLLSSVKNIKAKIALIVRTLSFIYQ